MGNAALRAAAGAISVALMTACNGSGYEAPVTGSATTGTSETVTQQVAPNPDPTGLLVQVVVGSGPGVVSLFTSGSIYFSANGRNPGGGCTAATSTTAEVCAVVAYLGQWNVVQVIAAGAGVETLFNNGLVFFSPDGLNLGGGGNTVAENDNCTPVSKLIPGVPYVYGLGEAVSSDFVQTCGSGVKPSSLGVNGRTQNGTGNLVYAGYQSTQTIGMAALGSAGAVVSLLADGSAAYSANYTQLPPSSKAVVAYSGSIAPVRIISVGGGVETQFADGSVYLSPDGLNLGGGGHSVRVNPWVLVTPHGAFGAAYGGRDSAKGAVYQNKLWLSGGFHGPQGSTSPDCTGVCSFYDLWYSSDWGLTWNLAHMSAVPSNTQPAGVYDSYSPLVAFGTSLWALGPSVWGSGNTDGTSGLTQVSLSTAAPAISQSGENSWALAVGASAYYLDTNTSQMSSSTGDLTAWTPSVTMTTASSAPFLPRCGAGVKHVLNKFWIMAGGACDYSATYNDVWSSSDGLVWEQENPQTAFSPRLWPCVAIDTYNTFWLIGGFGDYTRFGLYTQNMADVWYSKDGVNWKQYKPAVGSGFPDDGVYEPRHAPTCYVRPDTNTLIIAAGKGGTNADNLLDATNGDYAIMRDDVVSLQLPPQSQLP
jgi:hypothetical protein